MYLSVALSAGGTGDGQNKYTFLARYRDVTFFCS
jgi:hypothetical protein